MKKELLTVAEAAEVLQVCQNTIRARIKTGYLDGFKFGNQWRIINRDEWYKNNNKKGS